MSWFTNSLRKNKNEVTHYLDGVKGCGSFLEEQIRVFFFGIIKGLLNQLQGSTDVTDVKMILNSLRWKFFGKDHGPLKHMELFRVLYDGKLGEKQDDTDGGSLISSSWGKALQILVQGSEESKSVTEQLITLFESLFLSVIARLISQDDEPKIKLTNQLSMERSRSVIDENVSENLLSQCFDIIFRELSRYIEFISSYKGIDWNTYVKHSEAMGRENWFEKL